MIPAIIVDLDGTLADRTHRGPFEYHKLLDDGLNKHVAGLVTDYSRQGYTIIFMSGRENKPLPNLGGLSVKDLTYMWLSKHGMLRNGLGNGVFIFMRDEKDFRQDAVVKRELYETHVQPYYDVELVLDDRDCVVHMWRGLGLQCWQVANGDF